jgi:hypothetical protein
VESSVLALLIRYLRRERVYAEFTIRLFQEGATITPEIRDQIECLYTDRERARESYDEALRAAARADSSPRHRAASLSTAGGTLLAAGR